MTMTIYHLQFAEIPVDMWMKQAFLARPGEKFPKERKFRKDSLVLACFPGRDILNWNSCAFIRFASFAPVVSHAKIGLNQNGSFLE